MCIRDRPYPGVKWWKLLPLATAGTGQCQKDLLLACACTALLHLLLPSACDFELQSHHQHQSGECDVLHPCSRTLLPIGCHGAPQYVAMTDSDKQRYANHLNNTISTLHGCEVYFLCPEAASTRLQQVQSQLTTAGDTLTTFNC